MNRAARLILPVIFALGLLPPAVRAATVRVDVGGPGGELAFSPSTVTIQVGDRVVWTNQGGFHNVSANDGSFGNAISGSAWVYEHTFNTPGTFGYVCDAHSFAMSGTVIVQGGGGGEERGALRFTQAGYSVTEGTANATITVSRVNGDDGPVSVTYGAAAGTATAGADFTPKTGTLSWADNDDDNKTFTVAIANDTVAEASETILLTLSNPTGGATLDNARRTATLTLQDNDGPSGPPAAPSNLRAMVHSSTEIMLHWNDNSNNETGFRIERRLLHGEFEEVGSADAGATGTILTGLTPETFYLFRVRAEKSGVFSGYSNVTFAATSTAPAPCVAGPNTLCLNDGRFKVEVDWRTSGDIGSGTAVPVPSAPDSGLFYFFNSANLEMLIKALDACVFERYWVFYAATTNVEFSVLVTDTANGQVKPYYNPQGNPAAPVQDTDAFATCP